MYVHCSGASSQAKGFRGSGVDRKPLACIDGSGENTEKILNISVHVFDNLIFLRLFSTHPL